MSENLKGVHWTKYALCKSDSKFTSYHIDDVAYAKSVCDKCTVQIECVIANAESDGLFIAAGLSKYDRLLIQWKEVGSEHESNFGESSVYISEVVRRVRKAADS